MECTTLWLLLRKNTRKTKRGRVRDENEDDHTSWGYCCFISLGPGGRLECSILLHARGPGDADAIRTKWRACLLSIYIPVEYKENKPSGPPCTHTLLAIAAASFRAQADRAPGAAHLRSQLFPSLSASAMASSRSAVLALLVVVLSCATAASAARYTVGGDQGPGSRGGAAEDRRQQQQVDQRQGLCGWRRASRCVRTLVLRGFVITGRTCE